MYVCWSAQIIWCWDSMLCWVWTLPLCSYFLGVILFLLLRWQVSPCSLMFWVVLGSHGTWSCGPIQCCHCGLVQLIQMQMLFMFFASCFSGSTCLPYAYTVKPLFIVFVWGLKKKQWIQKNNRCGSHSWNRIRSGTIEIEQRIRENELSGNNR
jgi:hypothetical protein